MIRFIPFTRFFYAFDIASIREPFWWSLDKTCKHVFAHIFSLEYVSHKHAPDIGTLVLIIGPFRFSWHWVVAKPSWVALGYILFAYWTLTFMIQMHLGNISYSLISLLMIPYSAWCVAKRY